MATGGYSRLLKNMPPNKERDYQDTKEKAKKRIRGKLGEKLSETMREEYDMRSSKEKDGMIKTLLSEGKSQQEIKSLLGCGGYRVFRLSQEIKRNAEERNVAKNMKHTPKHALTDEDKKRIRDHIDSYDLVPGPPCAHRLPMLYFHDNCKYQWKAIHGNYVASLERGDRVVSASRFREIVVLDYPRLRLKRSETDVCNACNRIKTELEDPNLTEEGRNDLTAQKENHIGKFIHCKLYPQ